MALFKMLQGDESNISLDVTPFHEGWVYITNTGYFYVDLNIGTAESPNNQRIKLNAANAETLMGKSLAELQADWSVNDEADPAYIRNRTHWADPPQVHTLLASQDISFVYNADYAISGAEFSFTQIIDEGDSFTLVFDNTSYDVRIQHMGGIRVGFGNLSISGDGEDSGEPFVCATTTGDSWIMYTKDTNDTTHRIEAYYITQECHKLDRKYLPDDSILPTVYDEDNGLILVARDGTWNVEQPVGMFTEIGGEIFNSYNGSYANEAGIYAHAEGDSTKALGQASHTAGEGTIASGLGQYVFGTYNIEDDSESEIDWAPTRGKRKYVHIVGNGINKDRRSNAHTLDWSGNAWFAGDVKVGGTGQDDAAAKTLATTDDLSWNSLKDRPFYYDEDATIYEATITTNDMGGFFAYIDQSDAVKSYPALVDGKTYTVVFDDVSYSCVCVEGSMLGNLGLLEYGEDTGEPFAFVLNVGSMIGVMTTDTISTEHSIKVDGSVIKTIDEQYLPELPYITPQQGNQYWVSKSDFTQTNSMLTYKGKSYSSDHDRFMWFLTPDGIWNINIIAYDSAQKPAMSAFRMNYDSVTGTLHFYWKDESNTTKITTVMNAFLRDVNTGAYLRRETSVDSITIGTYTKKSHNVDFYINKNNPQPAAIVRSFDDYVETYSKDEIDALLSAVQPKSTTVTIPAANWTGNANPWSQVVTVNGATENSKLDLCPTAQQIVALQNAGVSLMLQNDSGVITAWAIGNKPITDYTINVLLTEVSAV